MPSSRSDLATSQPVMPGMEMSSMTMWGAEWVAASMQAGPSSAVMTMKPSGDSRSRTRSRWFWSSSAASTVTLSPS